jgi:flagellar biosynthesis chaperone FliJ
MAMSAPSPKKSSFFKRKDKAAPSEPPPPPPPAKPRSFSESRMLDMARRLQSTRDQIVVEGFADGKDKDQNTASLDRANRMREQLIRNGVPPERVVAVGRGLQSGHAGGVRVVEAPAPPDKPKAGDEAAAQAAAQVQEPIGTAHFESGTAMNVPRGSSAMVSILKTQANGDVVYLYDHESSRGNEAFPFKAIRLQNPTDSVLESGPVTVFGAGRFIGEGLVEPIPARSVAFVPYALDRQIVVERKYEDRDEIARIITVQRGVFSTEAKHIRRMTFILNNRLDEKAVVYVRHTVQPGFKLTKSPPTSERMGAAHLYRVELEAKGKTEVAIEETTPVFKTTDIRAPEGMEMIRAYISSTNVSGAIREKVSELLKLQKETADTDQQIATTRDQLQEYRNRMDELHAQIVTLTAVKTGASLLKDLEKKMQDISQRVSQATLRLVNLQEKLMIARIHFQDAVAELTLEDKKPDAEAKPAASEAPSPPAATAKAKKAK